MAEVTQIEYNSNLYDIKDATATTQLESLLSGGDVAKQLSNFFYPIGALFISTTTDDPNDLFGGTWTRLTDGVLRATNTNISIGTTTGNDTVTLTIDNMPAHSHPFTQPTISGKYGAIGSAGNNLYSFWNTQSNINSNTFTASGGAVGSSGNSQPFSIIPLSHQVAVWKRTALYQG